MNLPKAIALTCFTILAVSGNTSFPSVAQTQPANKTFGDWCRNKASLSPGAKHTVEVLLREAETTDCNAANQKLLSLTELLLDNNDIRDIEPLQSLTNLTNLELGNNQISDIQPLQSLTKLTLLSLGGNLITSRICPMTKPDSICNWEIID